jgi:hypothetical protein
MNQYPKDLGSEAKSDICQRLLLCDFLGAAVAVTQARSIADDSARVMRFDLSGALEFANIV